MNLELVDLLDDLRQECFLLDTTLFTITSCLFINTAPTFHSKNTFWSEYTVKNILVCKFHFEAIYLFLQHLCKIRELEKERDEADWRERAPQAREEVSQICIILLIYFIA